MKLSSLSQTHIPFRPQTREPYSVVQFVAERVDLPTILKLPKRDKAWTTFDICEAWAEKRGYVTARSNRLDVARAANHIMRMCLEGRICLSLRPPGYNAEAYATHSDKEVIHHLLALDQVGDKEDVDTEDVDESSSSEESGDEAVEDEQKSAAVLPAKNKFSLLEGSDDE